jgi:hypothetical protein
LLVVTRQLVENGSEERMRLMECGGMLAVLGSELPLLLASFRVRFADHSTLVVQAGVESITHSFRVWLIEHDYRQNT